MFDKTETYHTDFELFDELGLERFSLEGSHHDKYLVGEVRRGTGSVKIFMSSMGSQFWSFEIQEQNSLKRYKLSCGSGALSDYWDIAEKMMTSMIHIKDLEPAELPTVTEEERAAQLLKEIKGL